MPAAASVTYIHHTADPMPHGEDAPVEEERASLRDTQHYHQAIKRWNDIAYSFLVFPTGHAYEGRGWRVVGAHTEGQNSVSHAICFVGNFETEHPTPAALEAAARIHARGVRLGHIKPNAPIRGHRDAPEAATACPGANLYRKLPTIRKLAKEANG